MMLILAQEDAEMKHIENNYSHFDLCGAFMILTPKNLQINFFCLPQSNTEINGNFLPSNKTKSDEIKIFNLQYMNL